MDQVSSVARKQQRQALKPGKPPTEEAWRVTVRRVHSKMKETQMEFAAPKGRGD